MAQAAGDPQQQQQQQQQGVKKQHHHHQQGQHKSSNHHQHTGKKMLLNKTLMIHGNLIELKEVEIHVHEIEEKHQIHEVMIQNYVIHEQKQVNVKIWWFHRYLKIVMHMMMIIIIMIIMLLMMIKIFINATWAHAIGVAGSYGTILLEQSGYAGIFLSLSTNRLSGAINASLLNTENLNGLFASEKELDTLPSGEDIINEDLQYLTFHTNNIKLDNIGKWLKYVFTNVPSVEYIALHSNDDITGDLSEWTLDSSSKGRRITGITLQNCNIYGRLDESLSFNSMDCFTLFNNERLSCELKSDFLKQGGDGEILVLSGNLFSLYDDRSEYHWIDNEFINATNLYLNGFDDLWNVLFLIVIWFSCGYLLCFDWLLKKIPGRDQCINKCFCGCCNISVDDYDLNGNSNYNFNNYKYNNYNYNFGNNNKYNDHAESLINYNGHPQIINQPTDSYYSKTMRTGTTDTNENGNGNGNDNVNLVILTRMLTGGGTAGATNDITNDNNESENENTTAIENDNGNTNDVQLADISDYTNMYYNEMRDIQNAQFAKLFLKNVDR